MSDIVQDQNSNAPAKVHAGFPNPALDPFNMLDLNNHLIKNFLATYFMRVQGDSMRDLGIFDGDILIVDRSLTPSTDSIIVGYRDGDLHVGFFDKGKDYWGVITNSIHQFR